MSVCWGPPKKLHTAPLSIIIKQYCRLHKWAFLLTFHSLDYLNHIISFWCLQGLWVTPSHRGLCVGLCHPSLCSGGVSNTPRHHFTLSYSASRLSWSWAGWCGWMGPRNWANISESAGQVELKVVSSPASKLLRLPWIRTSAKQCLFSSCFIGANIEPIYWKNVRCVKHACCPHKLFFFQFYFS